MTRTLIVEIEHETAKKIAIAAGRHKNMSVGKVIDLMFADVGEASLHLHTPWNPDTDMAKSVKYDSSFLNWLLSANLWTVDELAECFYEKECCLEQIENCTEALADEDNWDDWNYDDSGVRKDVPVYESKEKYIERYDYDLKENIKALEAAHREIEKIKSSYEEDTGRNPSFMEWQKELLDFQAWYNSLYNPDKPVQI